MPARSRSAHREVEDASGIGQADRRARRVRVGADHDHGDQRHPPRAPAVQLVALPLRRDLLPGLRGRPVPDLLARDLARDRLPAPGWRAGAPSGRPVAGADAGGAPGSADRGAEADQGARLPGRDVAAAARLPRPAAGLDLGPASGLLARGIAGPRASGHEGVDEVARGGSLRSALVRGVGFAALWVVLIGAGHMPTGLATAAAATWLSLRLLPPESERIRLLALPGILLR